MTSYPLEYPQRGLTSSPRDLVRARVEHSRGHFPGPDATLEAFDGGLHLNPGDLESARMAKARPTR